MARFEYSEESQRILDTVTGERYFGNKQVCDLLNRLNKRADHNAELYFELLSGGGVDEIEYRKFLDLMKKYEISSVELLDIMLMEQRVW